VKNIPYLSPQKIKAFIKQALTEDVGPGDYSTLGAVPSEAKGRAQLIIKEPGVIAGLELASMIFKQYDGDLEVELLEKDGAKVSAGTIGLIVSGRAQSILTTERLVLNCMQRMSGIANRTAQLTELICHTKARLMDTRKTTPNFRMMEKWAVLLGGGLNHRFALYDMVMLKDNHVDFAGSVRNAILSTRKFLESRGLDLKIEIETRTLDEVKEVMEIGGVDIIMLDNMAPATMKAAVTLVDGRYPLEASGGITEQNLRAVAECGVDFISVGALTHQVKSLDISLKAF
jgi:nicotinate-nucleotide pyrophosphorylase (carboxylating)